MSRQPPSMFDQAENPKGLSAIEIQLADAFDQHWPEKFSPGDIAVWERGLRLHSLTDVATAIAEWRAGEKGHMPPRLHEIQRLLPPLPAPPKPAGAAELRAQQERMSMLSLKQQEQARVDAAASIPDSEFQEHSDAVITEWIRSGVEWKRWRATRWQQLSVDDRRRVDPLRHEVLLRLSA